MFINKIIANKYFLIVFSILISTCTVSSGKITVPSYCELTEKVIQQHCANIKELIQIVKQYQYDNNKIQIIESSKQREFAHSEKTLFSSFGITPKEYVLYMAENSMSVQAFFKKNPDIKKKIDELSAERNMLLEEYENLKAQVQ